MADFREKNNLLPRALVSVTCVNDGKKLEEIFNLNGVPVFCQCRGKGTATSEMLDIFGLGGTSRVVTVGFLPKSRVKELFSAMRSRLFYHQRGGGIAFSIPITALQGNFYQVLDADRTEKTKKNTDGTGTDMEQTEKKSQYTLIWASVAAGFSDDVIDAARAAGAKGGTVLKGLRCNSEGVSKQFGVSRQEEQDFVMIVTAKAKKTEVMSAISSSCGLGKEAHGIVLAFPVDDAMGLEE